MVFTTEEFFEVAIESIYICIYIYIYIHIYMVFTTGEFFEVALESIYIYVYIFICMYQLCTPFFKMSQIKINRKVIHKI